MVGMRKFDRLLAFIRSMMMHYCTDRPIECVEERRTKNEDKTRVTEVSLRTGVPRLYIIGYTLQPSQPPFPENRVATSRMTRRGYNGV